MASPLSQPGVSIDFGLNYSDIATHMLNEAGLRLWPLIFYLVPVNVSGYFFEPGCCINAAFVACLLVFGWLFFADVNFPGLSLVIEDILWVEVKPMHQHLA